MNWLNRVFRIIRHHTAFNQYFLPCHQCGKMYRDYDDKEYCICPTCVTKFTSQFDDI